MKKQGLILLFWCMTVASASAHDVEEVLKNYMSAWDEHNIPKIGGQSKVTTAVTDACLYGLCA